MSVFTCLGLFCFGGKIDNNNVMCSAATAIIGRVPVFCDKGGNTSARPAKLRACAPNDSQVHAVYTFYPISTYIKEDITSFNMVALLHARIQRADEICP